MNKNNSLAIVFLLVMQIFTTGVMCQSTSLNKDEMYRPQIHFTPKEHWINDPNGMVYYKGVYHLFYQYHPGSSVWGPMHWGHATSKDLMYWKEQPIAIYPDSIGTIFSGSAVVDQNNTSGFGKNGQPPLVAIFTQHNMLGEKAERNDFQNQSIAYSNDEGKTWIKYSGNPVLKNPGIKDFRDPKVMWYDAQKKWVMTLATKDRITFYSSKDFKSWKKESEFGATAGAHGGVWECPDLISFNDNGKQRWVLIVNLNPGAPNGGSGGQYFIGDFNGKTFTSSQTEARWFDYGPDNYAAVTWSNTGSRKILIGWMSNWSYAEKVPTETWRSAMTLPRELKLKHIGNAIYLTSMPVTELSSLQLKPIILRDIKIGKSLDVSDKLITHNFPCRINLSLNQINNFSLKIVNDLKEEIVVGYDKSKNEYFIDRSNSGKTAFQKDFAGRHTAPRISNNSSMNMTLIFDASSVELFADDGVTVMTSIFFPNSPYHQIMLQSSGTTVIKKLEYIRLKITRGKK